MQSFSCHVHHFLARASKERATCLIMDRFHGQARQTLLVVCVVGWKIRFRILYYIQSSSRTTGRYKKEESHWLDPNFSRIVSVHNEDDRSTKEDDRSTSSFRPPHVLFRHVVGRRVRSIPASPSSTILHRLHLLILGAAAHHHPRLRPAQQSQSL